MLVTHHARLALRFVRKLYKLVISFCFHYDVTVNQKSNNSLRKRKPAFPRVAVTIRLPKEVIRKIDQDLDQRDIPLSRNNWLLEAAIEKLRKNGAGGTNGAK
jgi:hypothetical protein